MNNIIFQLLFAVFTAAMLRSVARQKRAGILSPRGALFWALFWLVALAAVWRPDVSTRIANAFGIGRGTDFVVYVALGAMFALLFRLHIKIESLQRDITRVVRRDALNAAAREDAV
jgi:hypothetical protein